MNQVLMFLHILGALSMGFYIVLPFIIGKLGSMSLAAQEGAIATVSQLNRIAQFGLVVQLLTGGYLMTQGTYSVPWMIVVTLLFLAISAIGGIMGKPLRNILKGIQEKKEEPSETGKIRTLSALLTICFVVIVFFMVYSTII
ncbi:hypothetical protein PASE110613_09925 [Paenibacillus sediminis]|uniref:Succinate dehydrogenase hydrophobic anchor subunit n=1 Tax=Paenibacillus sediminis TaxID=664909 RepID=A0ABS4H5J0_9BACL|nr:hypothetical protein [Paenibacillus sediminis]MBP1937804.1 succinate dehydrogenase hydrophobic anchor subunit [Paenibacillus sediminis]